MNRLHKQAVAINHLLNPPNDPRLQDIPGVKKKPIKDKNFTVAKAMPKKKEMKPIKVNLEEKIPRKSSAKVTPVAISINSDYIRSLEKELADARLNRMLPSVISKDSLRESAAAEVDKSRKSEQTTRQLIETLSANKTLPALMPPALAPSPAIAAPAPTPAIAAPDPFSMPDPSSASTSTSTSTSTSSAMPPDDDDVKNDDVMERVEVATLERIDGKMMTKIHSLGVVESAEALSMKLYNELKATGLKNMLSYVMELDKNYGDYLAHIKKQDVDALTPNQILDMTLFDEFDAFLKEKSASKTPEFPYLEELFISARKRAPIYSSNAATLYDKVITMPKDFIADVGYDKMNLGRLFDYINDSKYKDKMIKALKDNDGNPPLLKKDYLTHHEGGRGYNLPRTFVKVYGNMEMLNNIQEALLKLSNEEIEHPNLIDNVGVYRLPAVHRHLIRFSLNVENLFTIVPFVDESGKDETDKVIQEMEDALGVGKPYVSPLTVIQKGVKKFFTLKPSPVSGSGIGHPLDAYPTKIKDLVLGLVNTLGMVANNLSTAMKEVKPVVKNAGAAYLAGKVRGDFTVAGKAVSMAGKAVAVAGNANTAVNVKLPAPNVAPLGDLAKVVPPSMPVKKPKRVLSEAQLANLARGREMRAARLAKEKRNM